MARKVNSFHFFLFLFVFAIGIYLRAGGLFQHATYVDELLLLTRGEPILTAENIHPDSLMAYTFKAAVSRGNSFAPFGVFVTRLLVGPNVFTTRGLCSLRLLSLLLSIGSLALFAHLCWVLTNKKNLSCVLLIFGVFACQVLQWVNAKQGHSYSAGVFGLLCSIELIIFATRQSSQFRILSALLGLTALTTLQYQLLLFNVSTAAVLIAIFWTKRESSHDSSSFFRWSASLFMAVSVIALISVNHLKSHMMTPYWVMDYMNLKGMSAQAVIDFFRNIFYVLQLSYTFTLGGENRVLGVIASLIFALGLVRILLFNSFQKHSEFRVYEPLIIFLGTWFLAYWIGKTPVSPTRHCMIYLVPILLIQLEALAFIETKLPNKITATGFYLLTLTIALNSLGGAKSYFEASKQEAELGVIQRLITQYQIKNLATWAHDYSTLRLLIDPISQEVETGMAWYGHIDSLPSKNTLFVELNSAGEQITEPLERFSKKFKMTPLLVAKKNFDFEPSSRVSYSFNLLKIWLFEPKFQKPLRPAS